MELLTAKEAREIAERKNPDESIEAYLNGIRITAQDGHFEINISSFKELNPILKDKLLSLGFNITVKYSNQISAMRVYKISW